MINRIGEVLKEKGAGNKDLVKFLNVEKEIVSRWVHNKQQPPLGTLNKIAEFLRVDIRELLRPSDWSRSEVLAFGENLHWETIKGKITNFLLNNPDGELETPNRRLKELEKLEKQLPKEYIKAPSKLLSVDKKELISLLGIKSGAAKSIINNIYDVVNNKHLKAKKRKQDHD